MASPREDNHIGNPIGGFLRALNFIRNGNGGGGTIDGARLLEDGGFRLLEDGGFRLLE